MRLQGKIAVITGAARGIGEAQARAFASEGASVVLIDIASGGQRVAEEIGDSALFIQQDVVDEAGWQRTVAQVEERYGRLDVLVNTAGVANGALPLAETSAETFMDALKVNTLGVFLGMRAVVEPMTRTGGGSIINVVSTAALMSGAGTYPYSASKWATRGITKMAAAELAKSGIRVNGIFPGPVATDMLRELGVDPAELGRAVTRAGFVADPRDIANATVFLASDEARYMFGAELVVDGGHSI